MRLREYERLEHGVLAIAAAGVESYEASIRLVTDCERAAARAVGYSPLRVALERLADVTRDTAAIQLSTIRWTLDL